MPFRPTQAWNIKLAVYLKHPGGTINSGEAGTDNRFPPGQWLYDGDKKQYSSSPEYQTLMAGHARFHRTAGQIAGQAGSGKVTNSEAAPGNGSEFAEASRSVIRAIRTLKAKVE